MSEFMQGFNHGFTFFFDHTGFMFGFGVAWFLMIMLGCGIIVMITRWKR